MLMAPRRDFTRTMLDSYESNLFFLFGHTATVCVLVIFSVNKCEQTEEVGAEVKLKATAIYWATTSEHLRTKKGGKALTNGRGGTNPKLCNVKRL